MLRSEFVGMTHYNPDCKEYHYIEESYYESPLDKDEFCRQCDLYLRQMFFSIDVEVNA